MPSIILDLTNAQLFNFLGFIFIFFSDQNSLKIGESGLHEEQISLFCRTIRKISNAKYAQKINSYIRNMGFVLVIFSTIISQK